MRNQHSELDKQMYFVYKEFEIGKLHEQRKAFYQHSWMIIVVTVFSLLVVTDVINVFYGVIIEILLLTCSVILNLFRINCINQKIVEYEKAYCSLLKSTHQTD